MSLGLLTLENLRCLRRAELELHPGRNLIIGANGSSPAHNAEALALIATGRVRVDDLITHRLPLESTLDALGIVSRGEHDLPSPGCPGRAGRVSA